MCVVWDVNARCLKLKLDANFTFFDCAIYFTKRIPFTPPIASRSCQILCIIDNSKLVAKLLNRKNVQTIRISQSPKKNTNKMRIVMEFFMNIESIQPLNTLCIKEDLSFCSSSGFIFLVCTFAFPLSYVINRCMLNDTRFM